MFSGLFPTKLNWAKQETVCAVCHNTEISEGKQKMPFPFSLRSPYKGHGPRQIFCSSHRYRHQGCNPGKSVWAPPPSEAIYISPLVFNWKIRSISCLHMFEAAPVSMGLSGSSFNLAGIQNWDAALCPVLVLRKSPGNPNWLYKQNAVVSAIFLKHSL